MGNGLVLGMKFAKCSATVGQGRQSLYESFRHFLFSKKKLSLIYKHLILKKILQLYSCLLHYLHRKWPQYKNKRGKEAKQQPIYAFYVGMSPHINILKPLTKYLHRLSSTLLWWHRYFLSLNSLTNTLHGRSTPRQRQEYSLSENHQLCNWFL